MLLTTRLTVEAAEENLRRGGTGGEKKDTTPAPLRGFPVPFSSDEKEALKTASGVILNGFVPSRTGDLELLSFNKGGQIFDRTKIQKYLETDFNPSTSRDGTLACETSFETLTSQIEADLGFSGKYNSLAGTFKANVGVSVGVTKRLEKETALFLQRDAWNFGYVDLPYHQDKSTLQALMDPIALSSLQGISSLSEAEDMVKTYGIGYFQRTYYGAVFKLSSKIEKQSWFESTDVKVAVGASYNNLKGDAAGGKSTTSVSFSKGTNSASMTVKHRAVGGDPTLLHNTAAWIESTKLRPVVTIFDVRPLYELLSPTIDGNARGLLEKAINANIDNYKLHLPGLDILPWVPLSWRDGRGYSSNWFSEENNGHSDVANGPIYNMHCAGRFCDEKMFQWMVYRGSIDIFKEHGHWSKYFSEEQSGYTCGNGRVVRQIQCRSSRCDEMKVLCALLKDGFRVNNVVTSRSNWFSEENGWHYCGGGDNHWLNGLGCRGRYCDEIQLRCVLIERRAEPSLEALPEDTIA